MAVRELPKDVLKMASGLISPSGLAGHRRQLCIVPLDVVTRVTADLDCRIVPHRQHYCEHWNCYWVIFNWTQKLVQELLSGNGKSALLNSVNEKEMVERHFCHFCS